MKYHQSGFKPKRARRGKAIPIAGTGVVVVILGALFIYGVARFNAPDAPEEQQENRLSDVLTPTPLDAIDAGNEIVGLDRIALQGIDGRYADGEATRAIEDERFVHTVKAVLPDIDREAYFYEGWLLRRIPFEFFSTGEMVTNEVGEFVLEWEGKSDEDYSDYTEVIITLEPYDDNPDPATHVAEGQFE